MTTMIQRTQAKLRALSWARIVSDLLCPPLVWGTLAFPIAFRDADSQEQALVWALVYVALVCVAPAVYIGWLVWRGHATDIHLQVRRERIRPLLVSLVCTTVAWWTLRALGAPPLLPAFTLVSLLQIAALFAITLVWQISMHMMSITCAVVALGALFGVGPMLVASPLIPVVGAARYKLKRHTPAQLVAGGLLGGLLTAASIFVLRPV